MVPRSRNARGLTVTPLADPPCVHRKGLTCGRAPPENGTLRGDAAARAVIGPLTKKPDAEPKQVQDCVERVCVGMGVGVASTRTVTEPYASSSII